MNDVVAPTDEPRIQAFGPEIEGPQGTGPDESSEVKKLRFRELEERAGSQQRPRRENCVLGADRRRGRSRVQRWLARSTPGCWRGS